MKPKITVLGSSNTDIVLRLPRFPNLGETVLGGVFSTAQGGKGANQAVAASRAGAEVQFISRVGNDDFGRKSIDAYRQDRIKLDHVITDPTAATGVAVIFVDSTGENCIGVASGANLKLDREQVQNAKKAIELSSLLLLQLEIPIASAKESIDIAHSAGIPTILNPAPAQTLESRMLESVTIVTPNEIETEILTGIPLQSDENIIQAAQQLRVRGVEIVIITLGPRGVYVASKHVNEFIPSFPAQAVDTTAAGDVFNGALATAIAEKRPLQEAVRFANAAAALSVTKFGAQPSAPMRSNIERLLRSY